MNIGIIGLGVVGKACRAGFERCNYTVSVHDIALHTDISAVQHTEICYICVPTPSNNNGGCDTNIVDSVVEQLININYEGIIAIKSTISPGHTKLLNDRYLTDRIVFVPEFLKERSAEYDFVFDQKLLLVGTENINHYYVVVRSHGDLPKKQKRVSPTEAEIMKYYHNTFNATRIVFANILYEVCESIGADYNVVKHAFLTNNSMPDEYLDVSNNLKGYGGACLPKDVRAMQELCNRLNLPYKFFETLDNENKKFTTTVFEGMRK